MSAILVTGGAGFLGAWIGRAFAEKGETPVLFDMAPSARSLDDRQHVSWPGDIHNLQDIEKCIAENDIRRIVHTVFVTEPLMGGSDPSVAEHIRLNINGTLNVLEAARRSGAGVVFISSKAVYGRLSSTDAQNGLPRLRETHPKAPTTLYGSTKLVCEHLLESYRVTWGLDYGIVRFATLWGPGKAGRYARLAPHSRMIETAVRGEPFQLEQGGDQLDDMIYVRDAAAGVAALALAPMLGGEDFNLGTGRAHSMKELAGFLVERFPSWKVAVGDGGDYLGAGEVATYCLMESTKAQKAFGFQANYDLCAAASNYIDWLEKSGRDGV